MLWTFILVAGAGLVAGEDGLEVQLDGLGKIRGNTAVARNKQTIFQFLGVPFAEPPTGENR